MDKKTFIEPDNGLLAEIIAITKDFPAPPTILTRILELTSEPMTPIEKVESAICSDAGIAAKVLKLSNSAFYGRSRDISSIRDAIVLLGIHTIRSLIVASSTHSLYSAPGQMQKVKTEMWQHSLATGIFCKQIARAMRTVAAEEAFLSGLLHDVGKLVLVERFPDKFERILYAKPATSEQWLDMEHEIFGFTHDQVGTMLMDSWLFPDALVEAVEKHHVNYDFDTLSGMTAIADRFVSAKGYNFFTCEFDEDILSANNLDETAENFEYEFNEQKKLYE